MDLFPQYSICKADILSFASAFGKQQAIGETTLPSSSPSSVPTTLSVY